MPEKIGQYEIKGELGRGAMAVVWRAWDFSLQREVAIKEPRRNSEMPDWVAHDLDSRFILEGHAAARLNHPNIITVYGADVFEGRPAIVMELLEGSTLSELIDRKQLTPERIYSIWMQLLDALIYAHSMGVIHRDIKPDNIFVTSNDLVKLTDFGVAHLESGASASGEQDKVIAGSPGYMSPEQAAGEPTDARSDLFSFSVVAYEMLALANPFGATEGLAREELLLRTQASEALPPFGAIPEVSTVIAKGLRQRPQKRWQTGEQYRNALNRAMDQERYVFMSQRRGRPFALKDEAGAKGEGIKRVAEPFALEKLKYDNRNALLVALIVVLGLVILVGIMAGNEVIIMLAFVAMIVFGAAWGLRFYKGKVDGGEIKTPNLSKAGAQLSESFDLMAPEALPTSSPTRQLTIKITTPFGFTSIEEITAPLTIGRDQLLGNHVLQDDRVSAQHLSLSVEPDSTTIYVNDIGSKNGTLLDGTPLTTSKPLTPSSIIHLGDTTIEVLAL
jgi:serine/threonine protein kinase